MRESLGATRYTDPMLTRIRIKNFRCFTDFEWRPRPLELIVGGNGVGKSALLDVITRIKRVVIEGQSLDTQFPRETLPRWSNAEVQEFELDFGTGGVIARYALQLKHYGRGSPSIQREVLCANDSEVYRYEHGRAQSGKNMTQPFFPQGGQGSALLQLASQANVHEIKAFLRILGAAYCVRAIPATIAGEAKQGDGKLDLQASNFAAWYLDQAVNLSSEAIRLREDLKAVMPGFDSVWVDPSKQGRRELLVRFGPQGSTERAMGDVRSFDLAELSDGQRVLILLYSLVHFAVGSGATVCFDEPDNYVSLREIQPWLMLLMETVQAGKGQAIIVSHHPELLNQLVPDHATVFRRAEDGGVIAEPYKPSANGALTPAEEVARGWNNV